MASLSCKNVYAIRIMLLMYGQLSDPHFFTYLEFETDVHLQSGVRNGNKCIHGVSLQFSKCRNLLMHSGAAPVTYPCWVTNVLKVLKLSSFSLSSFGLGDFIVIFLLCVLCEEQAQIVSEFKLQRVDTGILKMCWKQLLCACTKQTFPLNCTSLQRCEPTFLFLFFFFSLNKIRFAKTQCEFRDYELGR